jgi:putative FmdB family regulatory protein
MPLYEYQCEACDHRFERIQKFSDPLVDVCPKCGKGPVRKLISSPAIQFKGSGWYITDYAKKSSSDSGSTSNAEAAADKKSDKAKSDKSESGSKSDTSSTSTAPPANTTKSE